MIQAWAIRQSRFIGGCALIFGALSGATTAIAQEPSKEETIAWLQEKIVQGSLGCIEKRTKTFSGSIFEEVIVTQGSNTLDQSNRSGLYSVFTDASVEKSTTYESGDYDKSLQSNEFRVEFAPTQLAVDAIELRSAETRGDDVRCGKSRILTEYNCHSVYLPLMPQGVVVRRNGRSQTNGMSVNVNSWELAERIKSAFEHWAKQEKSGAGEPF